MLGAVFSWGGERQHIICVAGMVTPSCAAVEVHLELWHPEPLKAFWLSSKASHFESLMLHACLRCLALFCVCEGQHGVHAGGLDGHPILCSC
jgi:hypothetical protein